MSRFPLKCIIDTNVPKIANLALAPNQIVPELFECVMEAIILINQIIKKGGLVLDDADEIFNEYHNNLAIKGQPGLGDRFMKWVHDNRWNFPDEDRVSITKDGDTYVEFPNHEGLKQFDPSDRKFVAVANTHPIKPPIIEATDSKWWGWKDALLEMGIKIIFLSPEYVEKKYKEKFPDG